MAKNYSGMSTEELQELAKEQKQRNAALNQLAKSDPSAMSAMTGNERQAFLRSQEQQRRDDWHQANAEARKRRLDDMTDIAARDPSRYNAAQVKAATNWLQQQEQKRQFDEAQTTERFKAERDAAGKIGYGKEAESIRSGANTKIAETEWGTRAKIAEQEAAAKKYLGEQESKDRRYGIDAEHGVVGPDGKVTPGSRERAIRLQAEGEVQKQSEANKGLAAQAEINRQNEERKIDAQIKKAMISNGGKVDSAKTASQAKIIASAISGGAMNGKDAATVLGELATQYKDNPDMLAAIQAAGGGRQQQPTNIPGYSPEKVAELQKRGYKWNGKQWTK